MKLYKGKILVCLSGELVEVIDFNDIDLWVKYRGKKYKRNKNVLGCKLFEYTGDKIELVKERIAQTSEELTTEELKLWIKANNSRQLEVENEERKLETAKKEDKKLDEIKENKVIKENKTIKERKRIEKRHLTPKRKRRPKIEKKSDQELIKTINNSTTTNNNSDQQNSCNNCMLQYRGECIGNKEVICEYYKHRPYISNEMRKNWPTIGDATYYRLNSGKERY